MYKNIRYDLLKKNNGEINPVRVLSEIEQILFGDAFCVIMHHTICTYYLMLSLTENFIPK